MMSAYFITGAAADSTDESRRESAFGTRLGRLRRLFCGQLDTLSEQLSCSHEQLVFDEINDVYCANCRKDFTG